MSVKNVKIRFNLDKENDRRAYDYLQNAEKSYSKAVISAICGYMDLSEMTATEDTFLERIISTIREEVAKSNPLGGLLQFVQTPSAQTPPEKENSAETEAAALKLFDDIYTEIIDTPKQEFEKNKKRIAALDKLIQVAFEKNVLGTLRDDLFERMTANYEQEQRDLIQAVAELEQRLANAEQDNSDLRAFLSIIRKCTDLKELTPELVNRLITKIEVFDSTKDENGKKHVPIKVHFIGVGILEIPDAQTIIDAKEEIRKNPPSAA